LFTLNHKTSEVPTRAAEGESHDAIEPITMETELQRINN